MCSNCNSCFCNTFKDKKNIALSALQINSLALSLGLQVPPIPTGTRRITNITLLGIDPNTCIATFILGFNQAPTSQIIVAPCNEIFSFAYSFNKII